MLFSHIRMFIFCIQSIIDRITLGALYQQVEQSRDKHHCLSSFNYKWYSKSYWIDKESIYLSFERKEYFEHFKAKVSLPKYNHLNKPMDVYAVNWNAISRKAKERADYKCNDCWSALKLQTHHMDHNKWNNSPSNLEVLCYSCHAKHHSHM